VPKTGEARGGVHLLPGPVEATRAAAPAQIRLEQVGRTYGAGEATRRVLGDVTFTVPARAFVAIAGPSGSGKTTLLSIVAGLDTPSAGRVWVNGRDIYRLREAELSAFRLRSIGFVFQDFSLIPVLSAAENVAFPLLFRSEIAAGARRSRVMAVLEQVGLGGKEGRRPHELSAGERQRVVLARALAGDPAILIADEPTAQLDEGGGEAIIHLMRTLNGERGTTCLYATHDPRLIALADSTLRLRNGLCEERVA